ncbi:PREDICTED: DNA-directed RNA polymerase II subunit rpb1-like [Papilio xuthus]|uniref:DNA-directed RNA polymerase II subunit rpb1-like n=1 Tax=Papilio xuthus TaxID=66420 RepID=A0AAJ7E487_PAPXU|nr:PREDICTED: DNA-directed RNA polymerase II subunit rpb1-like [Papilio xuthus]
MNFLVLTVLVAAQLVAASSGPAPTEQTRARRSFQHYATPQLYGNGNQYYTSQTGYEVSPQLYSEQISPKYYNSRTVSQGSVYRLPSSSTYYPSSQTYTQYTSAPRVQYGVQAAPAYAQVSARALYNAEHTEHASSSSHYRLQAAVPAAVSYAQPSAQYAQPSVQYVQSTSQYVQPSSAQYIQPSVQYVQNTAQYAQPSWQQGTWTANNPWC